MGNIGSFSKGNKCWNKSHNESGGQNRKATKEYNTWVSMKIRCCNPKNKKFKDYGGRGIIICDRWINSYENFLADMGRAPSKSHSIDRIDVNGNYEPLNCRWTTPKIQSNNQRKTRKFEFKGQIYSIFELSSMCGIPHRTMYHRILIRNWSVEDAVTKPLGTYINDRQTAFKKGHAINLGKKYKKPAA